MQTQKYGRYIKNDVNTESQLSISMIIKHVTARSLKWAINSSVAAVHCISRLGLLYALDNNNNYCFCISHRQRKRILQGINIG
jgi:hypothetical protein